MYHYTLKKDPSSSHQTLASLIAQYVPKGRILDVGCGKGFLPSALGSRFNGQIVGIDKNPQVLERATQQYSQTHCVDITDIKPFPFKGTFDVIVFADILEHLAEPVPVVKRLLKYLRGTNSIVVISVPNVANWFIRLNLLFGKFQYSDRGILDRTHLRFFTQQSIRSLIAETGLHIIEERVTPIPIPLIIPLTDSGRPLFFLHQFNSAMTRWYPSLIAYQFVFVCGAPLVPRRSDTYDDGGQHPADADSSSPTTTQLGRGDLRRRG